MLHRKESEHWRSFRSTWVSHSLVDLILVSHYASWIGMAEYACRPLRIQYEPTLRFWDSNLSQGNNPSVNLPLRFEASSYISKTALAALLHMALIQSKLGSNASIEVVDKDQGEISKGNSVKWFLIGSHLLNFYRTYTTEEGLEILRSFGQQGEVRRFPSPKNISSVAELLKISHSGDHKTGQDTHTEITVKSLNSVLRKKRKTSQLQLASISATVVGPVVLMSGE
ncbi:hypothetical protein DL93DRAFT_578281 [Clavulina sp. PMI_390]|nr:hypothetical protein DL93DRAFT_578281 [Clavulina sp. PMI_390]